MAEHKGITLVGLGPGDPGQITRQAWDWLTTGAQEIWLRTRQHPTVAGLPSGLDLHDFDSLYETAESFEAVYAAIVDQVMQLGQRPQGVTYAVPGHPFVAEATGPEIARRAAAAGIPLRVIEAISFLEPTFTALGLDPFPQLAAVDALELAAGHVPSFPPSAPALICQVYSRQVAAQVKLVLMEVYPAEHPVRLVHAAGTDAQLVEDLALYEIDRSQHTGLLTTLFLPALAPDTSLEAFQEIIAHLRAPDGCPWDREQTHQSLRKHLLEETYEALEALDNEDVPAMVEEFGDLLLQIVLHAQIGSEANTFRMADILQGIYRKIVRRHPHVFGDVQLDNVDGVLTNWEKLKSAERSNTGAETPKGLLDGVPGIFPALAQAQELQERAARVGFDWADEAPVVGKVTEELDEVLRAPDEPSLMGEVGDLLFAVVNLARWKKIDAEAALRGANTKFRRRFAYIEKQARAARQDLHGMTLEQMDVWWDEAKKLE